MKPAISLPVLVTLAVIAVAPASALPRFASREGTNCQSCHVDPTGGGMRQAFGEQYGRDKLPVPEWSKEFALDDFSNLITNFLGVGADFQTLYFSRQVPDSGGASHNQNAFFQMQGDVYLNFKMAKNVSIYLSKGLYSGFEAFGLLRILPEKGYIKVGKFLPAYGTKIDDHTTFIRTYTGFSPELARPELTGGEVGVFPGPLGVSAGVYNGTDGFGASTGNSKAFLGRVTGMFPIAEGVNLGLGGNLFTKNTGTLITKDLAGNIVSIPYDRLTLEGGLGSFSYRELTVFGEVDVMKRKVAGVTTNALVSYVEADCMVVGGVDVKLAYDFYDPDTRLKTGSISRYSVGVEFFPLPGVEMRPVYRFVRTTPVELHDDEFDLVFHFFM